MLNWTLHVKGAPERAHHAAVAVGNKVYSFGGYCVQNTYMYYMDDIDVHVFHTVSLRWMKLPPVIAERGERPPEVPSMRWGHTAVLIEDITYIWGGRVEYTWELCNMLYAFEVDTHRWYRPRVSGTVPEKRQYHSACVLGKVMYIYGGYIVKTGYTNGIYMLDTATMVWSLMNTSGAPPPASSFHSTTIIGTKMFVFGGCGEQGEGYNNIRVFETETNFWLSTPSSQLHPEGCWGHATFSYNDELYIFGGRNIYQNINDLWKFSPETFSWKNIEPKGRSPPRMTNTCCCKVGNRCILFGGNRHRVPSVDDLYILDLSPSLKTLCKLAVIQYNVELPGLPNDIRWELAAMTTKSKRKD